VARVRLAAVEPLWFDEAWSVALAATPTWRALVHECHVDVNAPLFYGLARLWAMVAGPSDLALRLPGLLCVAVAGALPLCRRIEGLSREGRLTWGLLIYAWWGVGVFLAGRCYGLLLALSVLQCLLFADLLRRPTLRRALAWCAVGALVILTHYYGLIVTASQGLIYLVACRKAAFRTWPAALAFAPAAGWLAFHAGQLSAYGSPTVAWHATLGAAEALALSAATLNPSAPLIGLAVLAALCAGGVLNRRRDASDDATHLWLCVAASALALALTLLSGMFKPSLTARYLLPTAPGLLLGLVLLAQRCPRPRLTAAALAGAWLLSAVPLHFGQRLHQPPAYGFETASGTLAAHGVSQVVFVWDHEADGLIPRDTLQRVGGVFFARAGRPLPIVPIAPRADQDANALVQAAAGGERPGVVWLYNRAGHTSARLGPPVLQTLDPRWRCERAGDDTVGTLACWRD
jgi:mannosyltransferase